MILLYWNIGRMIAERQEREGWGAAVIPRLARDIRNEMPEVKGFSERNLKYMIGFAREYGAPPIVQQPVAQLREAEILIQLVAEYALHGVRQPIGVSEYELTRALPKEFQSSLPSIEQIEEELSRDMSGQAKSTKRRQRPVP